MSAEKITPGAWRVAVWNCHAPTTVITDGPDGRPLVIAECSGHGRACSDSIADARAIASTKDVQMALAECIGSLRGAAECLRRCDSPKTAAKLEALALAAMGVLVKAGAVK